MDGRTFFRRFRDGGDQTPVLILSAYGANRACSELGAEGAMDKPFDPDRLVETVTRMISNAAANGASP
jgi:DNA-binding response OmpR family regulator